MAFDFRDYIARLSLIDWQAVAIFAAVFIIILALLPMPYFYELYECPIKEQVSIGDCTASTVWGFFSGVDYFMQGNAHGSGWDYFGAKHISIIYIPLWTLTCFMLTFALFFAYLNFRDYHSTKPIFTEARKKAIGLLAGKTISAFNSLEAKARFRHQKAFFSALADSIKSTPLIFYDRAAQRFPFGSDGFSSHAAEYLFSKRQASKGAAKEKVIALPSWHIFKGEGISRNGTFMLWRQWIALQKEHIRQLMESKDIPDYFTDSAYVDIITVVLAKELGCKEAEIKKCLKSKMASGKIFQIAKNW